MMGTKGAKGAPRLPKKNTKLLEFNEEIGDFIRKTGTGSGRVRPNIVAVATDRDGFLAPVRGAKEMQGTSMVTWSSLAAKSASEAAEEVGSVSEEDITMSESSCSATPMPRVD